MALFAAAMAINTIPIQQGAALLKKLPLPKVKQITVYVTNTGKKYHMEDCGSLRNSSIPMPLSEARKKYDPCKICHPPE